MSYDPSTHIIRWRVDVNPYHYDIYSGTITDDLSSYKQIYAGGFVSEGGSGLTGSDEFGTLTVNIGNIGTGSSWFEFDAYVYTQDDYTGNHNGIQYRNIAKFTGYLNSDTSAEITSESEAWVTVTSTMLVSEGNGFSYNASGELELAWKLTVNHNKMPIINSAIEDSLPAGLSYVEGSLAVTNVSGGRSSYRKRFFHRSAAYDTFRRHYQRYVHN